MWTSSHHLGSVLCSDKSLTFQPLIIFIVILFCLYTDECHSMDLGLFVFFLHNHWYMIEKTQGLTSHDIKSLVVCVTSHAPVYNMVDLLSYWSSRPSISLWNSFFFYWFLTCKMSHFSFTSRQLISHFKRTGLILLNAIVYPGKGILWIPQFHQVYGGIKCTIHFEWYIFFSCTLDEWMWTFVHLPLFYNYFETKTKPYKSITNYKNIFQHHFFTKTT